jgi:hypothetical protein
MGRNLEWAQQHMKTNKASEKEAHVSSSRDRISQKKDTNHKAIYSFHIRLKITYNTCRLLYRNPFLLASFFWFFFVRLSLAID